MTTQELKRGFDFRSAFSLAFADISPIVALYVVFSIAVLTAGPAFWWAFPLVLGGQLLVALTFGELASRWPYEGSVYQWARHLVGPRYGWFTAWAYMWGLTIALSTLCFGAAGFLAAALGITPTKTTQTLIALAILVFASVANMAGRVFLKVFVYLSVAAEIIGSIGIGTALLIFYHVNPFSALFNGAGTASGSGWLFGPFLAAAAFVGWSFLGFEAAGSIAEEVTDPERNVPKALVLALLAVGLIVMYSSLGVLLAIPDLGRVMSGQVLDPVSLTLETHFGATAGRALLVLFVVGFIASFLAVQAAVSRCIWASARDRMLPGSGFLARLSKGERLPHNSVLLTAVVAAALLFLTGSKLYAVLITFTNAGFYTAYGLPVLAAAYLRLRGRWRPGRFTLGRAGPAVTYAAAIWMILQTLNIAWPRKLYGAWYLQWGVLLTTAVLGVAGVVVSWWVFRRQRAAP